ncbi:MAG: hypothetical protein AAFR52_11310 [Pseudomonadota bacterium]
MAVGLARGNLPLARSLIACLMGDSQARQGRLCKASQSTMSRLSGELSALHLVVNDRGFGEAMREAMDSNRGADRVSGADGTGDGCETHGSSAVAA